MAAPTTQKAANPAPPAGTPKANPKTFGPDPVHLNAGAGPASRPAGYATSETGAQRLYADTTNGGWTTSAPQQFVGGAIAATSITDATQPGGPVVVQWPGGVAPRTPADLAKVTVTGGGRGAGFGAGEYVEVAGQRFHWEGSRWQQGPGR